MSQVDPADMTEEELEARRERLKDAVEQESAQLEDAEENALETLAEATDGEDDELHTVALTDELKLRVKDTLPGKLEKKAAAIQDDGSVEAFQPVYEVLAELIIGVEECKLGGGSEELDFGTVGVWENYHDVHGTTRLMEFASMILEPYQERQQELQDQRQFRGQR